MEFKALAGLLSQRFALPVIYQEILKEEMRKTVKRITVSPR
jgi:hypothetical protein